MWKDKLCKTFLSDLYKQSLWKSSAFLQLSCAKKVVTAVKEKPVFHIFFPYCYYNYLKISIYIFIFYYLQEMRDTYAFYL